MISFHFRIFETLKTTATKAYLSNYSKGWKGLGNITEVSKDDFKKWIDSSTRKTKPFSEYSSVKQNTKEEKPVDDNSIIPDKLSEILQNELGLPKKEADDIQRRLVDGETIEGLSHFRKNSNGYQPSFRFKIIDGKIYKIWKSDFSSSQKSPVSLEDLKRRDDNSNSGNVANAFMNVKDKDGKTTSQKVHEDEDAERNKKDSEIKDKIRTLLGIEKDGSILKSIYNKASEDVKKKVDELLKERTDLLQKPYENDSFRMPNDDKLQKEEKNTSLQPTEEQKNIGQFVIDLIKKAGIKVSTNLDEMRKSLNLKDENSSPIRTIIQKMITWHGSPYEFNKFDFSHMGEGEGNQAIAWGGYVSEVEGIGRSYARMGKRQITWKGQNVITSMVNGKDHPVYAAYNAIMQNGTVAKAKTFIESIASQAETEEMKGYWNDVMGVLNTSKKSDFKLVEPHHIYSVDIPEDKTTKVKMSNGKWAFQHSYLDWGEDGGTQTNFIADKLYNYLIDNDTEGLYGNDKAKEELKNEITDAFSNKTMTGKTVYGNVSAYLGSDKKTSEFLSLIGYTGVRYPAGYFSTDKAFGKSNYVIFNDKDMKITSHTQFLKTNSGEVYGFVKDGKIYIDPTMLNPNTPIHEYTHLWDITLQNNNPELWKRGVDLMKQSSVWNEVINDEHYADIKDNEDLVASEVHSRLAGKDGEKLFTELYNAAKSETAIETAKKVSVIKRLQDWVGEVWNWIKDTMTPWSKEEADKISIKDFINMPISDLIKGTNIASEKNIGSEEQSIIDKANSDGTYMKAPNGKDTNLDERQWVQVRTKAFKQWFGDWENDPENSSKVVDENGEPKVVYHAGSSGINIFSNAFDRTGIGRQFWGKGFYFSGLASSSSWAVLYKNKTQKDATMYKVFLNIRSPYYKAVSGNVKQNEYDGVILKPQKFYTGDSDWMYIVGDSNQIKSATDNNGEFSSSNDDIRYRISDKKSLVGVHNISEEKLLKAINQGGLANPSMAVIDINNGTHNGYGEISLVAPKTLVDSNSGRNAGTFTGDAWSPTYPHTEIQGIDREELNKQLEKEIGDEEVSKELARSIYDYAENSSSESERMALFFLREKGIDSPILKYKNITKDGNVFEKKAAEIYKETSEGNFDSLSEDNKQKLVDAYLEEHQQKPLDENEKSVLIKEMEQSIKGKSELVAKNIRRRIEQVRKYGAILSSINTECNQSLGAYRDSGKTDVSSTISSAIKYIRENNLGNEYRTWLKNKINSLGGKEVIFAGYKSDGTRKYMPNNAQNASIVMNSLSNTNAYDNTGISAFKSKLLQRMTSLDQIRKNKSMLGKPEETETLSNELFNLINELSDLQKISDNQFSNIDYAELRLQEAIEKKNPVAYLKNEYGYKFPNEEEFRNKLNSLIDNIKKAPTKYFETKFNRPVQLNEFHSAVVPKDASEQLIDALNRSKIKVFTYDRNSEDSRAQALKDASDFNDVRFRTSTQSDELEVINQKFNDELNKQIKGELHESHIYDLGYPSEALQSSGIPNWPIELRSARLEKKSNQENHVFDFSLLKDLPKLVQNPIMVFNSKTDNNSKVILVEITDKNNNFVIVLKAQNKFVSGRNILEINEIRSIYPKDNSKIIEWINSGNLLEWVNKDKAINWLGIRRSNSADDAIPNNSLSSAANIVNDFQNPTLDEGKIVAAVEDLSNKLNTPIKIVKNTDEITDIDKKTELEKRGSKGFYDVKTGEVTIVLPNAENIGDAEATVMHEVVAHKGLRGLLGDKFEPTMMNVYNSMPEYVVISFHFRIFETLKTTTHNSRRKAKRL